MKNNRTLIPLIAVLALVLVAVGSALIIGSNADKTENSMNDMPMNTAEQAPAQSEQSTPAEGKTAAPAASTTSVGITDYAFNPKAITVKVGDTVTWTNNDTVHHDVTSDDGITNGPASELLGKGETYSFTFTKAGTYTYHCSPHPYMKGTVVVTE